MHQVDHLSRKIHDELSTGWHRLLRTDVLETMISALGAAPIEHCRYSTAAPFLGRRLACSTRLRMRSDFGVTSTSSSSAMNSIACSSVRLRYGTRRTASSEPEARMLDIFFSRTQLTSRSLSRECSPTIMP